MKRLIAFFVLVTALAVTNLTMAQTPYDNFEPEQAGKVMLSLPSMAFQVNNQNEKGTIGKLELDIKSMTLNLKDANNIILSSKKLDPKDLKWTTMDPLAEKYYSTSPYAYCLNNPIKYIDPNGCSTHTDSSGNVVAVYNDDDNAVYQHNIDANTYDGTKFSKKDGTKKGETENWDEFLIFDKQGNYSQQIEFGKEWTGIIGNLASKAEDMNIVDVMFESRDNGTFDIKTKGEYKDKGRLLDNKYASAESAGNYLAGYNAGQSNSVPGGYGTFQQMAGALHVLHKRGESFGITDVIKVIGLGMQYGPAPYYGENEYQYRMSLAGWRAATK